MHCLFLVLITCAQELDPESIRLRIVHQLVGSYKGVDELKRSQLAEFYARGILQSVDKGHDPQQVLARVEWSLANAVRPLDKLIQTHAALAKMLNSTAPDAARSLSVPEELQVRVLEANLEYIRHYLSEMVARERAGDEAKDSIVRQVHLVSDEVRSAARARIAGPYADGVINKIVELATASLLGRELGNPVDGGLFRALTADEIAQVVRGVRDAASKTQAVEASSPIDRDFLQTGELDVDQETDAIRLSSQLAEWLYKFFDFNYPQSSASLRAYDGAIAEIMARLDAGWKPIEEQVERHRTVLLRWRALDSRSPQIPGAERRSPSSVVTAEAPSTSFAQNRSEHPTPRRSPQIAWSLACAGVLILLGLMLFRRLRKRLGVH